MFVTIFFLSLKWDQLHNIFILIFDKYLLIYTWGILNRTESLLNIRENIYAIIVGEKYKQYIGMILSYIAMVVDLAWTMLLYIIKN